MSSAGARTYNGSFGAEPPAGSMGRASGQGVRERSPLNLKMLLAFGHPTEAANLTYSLLLYSLCCCAANSTSCAGGRHNMSRPCDLDL